jgi:hypothetical protein
MLACRWPAWIGDGGPIEVLPICESMRRICQLPDRYSTTVHWRIPRMHAYVAPPTRPDLLGHGPVTVQS